MPEIHCEYMNISTTNQTILQLLIGRLAELKPIQLVNIDKFKAISSHRQKHFANQPEQRQAAANIKAGVNTFNT